MSDGPSATEQGVNLNGAEATPERVDTTKNIIEAFRSGVDRMEQAAAAGRLTPGQKWALEKAIKGTLTSQPDRADKVDLEAGKLAFNITFKNDETGETFTQEEGIPVEDLLDFLQGELGRNDLSEDERENLQKTFETLEKNSFAYHELHPTVDDAKNPRGAAQYKGRKKLEAKYISVDERRKENGNQETDWQQAEEVLGTLADPTSGRRRELRLPPQEQIPTRVGEEDIAEREDRGDEGRRREEEEDIVEPPPPPPGPPEEGDGPPPPLPPPEPLKKVLEGAITNRSQDAWKAAWEIANKVIQHEQERGSAWDLRNLGRKVGIGMIKGYWRARVATQIYRAMQESKNPYATVDVNATTIGFADLFHNRIANLNVDTNARRAESESAGQAHVEMTKEQGVRWDTVRLEGRAKAALFEEIINPMRRGDPSPLAGGGRIDINDPVAVQNALRAFVNNHRNEIGFEDLNRMFRDSSNEAEVSQNYATDIQQLARDMQDLINRGVSQGEIEEHAKILLANKLWASANQPNFDAATRAARWVENGSIRGVVLPTAAVAAAYALGAVAVQSGTRMAAGWMVGGALGGIIAGAGIAAARRRAEVFENASQVRTEKGAYGTQTEVDPATGRPVNEEARRRQRLEQYVYQTENANTLIANLNRDLAGDMNVEADRNRVLDALADIQARLNLAENTTITGKTVDLITFGGKTQVEQGRLALVKWVAVAKRQLAPYVPNVDAALQPRIDQRQNYFVNDVIRPTDARLAGFATGQALRAAALTFAVGGVGFLGSQQAVAFVGRAADSLLGTNFRPGATIVENVLHGRFADVTEPGVAVGFSIDQARELYQGSGGITLDNGTIMNVDPNHLVTFRDALGNNLTVPETRLLPDGRITVQGGLDTLPPSLRTILEQWNPNSLPSLQDRVIEAVAAGRPETINVGNLELVINGNDIRIVDRINGTSILGKVNNLGELKFGSSLSGLPDMQAIRQELLNHNFQVPDIKDTSVRIPSPLESFKDFLTKSTDSSFTFGRFEGVLNRVTGEMVFRDLTSGTEVRGVVDTLTGKITFDQGQNPTINFESIKSLLSSQGFSVEETKIPPLGNTIDRLLKEPADVLRKKGIVETGLFEKSWNFHVLRPDIVDATGMHTHNELTLQLGGEYHVAPHRLEPAGALRHGPDFLKPGELKFTGTLPQVEEIMKGNGGMLPSNLFNVPDAADPKLNQLILSQGGLKVPNLVYVVELNNGSQLMIAPNDVGVGKLPQELYNPQTGDLIGVKDIAVAVLEKPDHSVLTAKELLQTGTIPKGSIVNSLASERFVSTNPPPLPPVHKLAVLPPDIPGKAHSFEMSALPDPTKSTILTPPAADRLNIPIGVPPIIDRRHPISPGGEAAPRPPVFPPVLPTPEPPVPPVRPPVPVPGPIPEPQPEPTPGPTPEPVPEPPIVPGPVEPEIAEPESDTARGGQGERPLSEEQLRELGQKAFGEITGLGVKVDENTKPTDLLNRLVRTHGWKKDLPTEDYVRQAVEHAKRQKGVEGLEITPGVEQTVEEAIEMTGEEKAVDGQKALQELRDKGFIITFKTSVDDLMSKLTTLSKENAWRDNPRTRQYINNAIAVARVGAGEEAIVQIKDAGVEVTGESQLDKLMEELKQKGWQDDQTTREFVQCAIDLLKATKPTVPEQPEEGSGEQGSLPPITDGEVEVGVDNTQELLGRNALQEITTLGYAVKADSDADELLYRLTSEKGWDASKNKENLRYIEAAIEEAEAQTPKKQEFETEQFSGAQFVVADPRAQTSQTIYLSKARRQALGVRAGDSVKVRLGDQVIELQVARPRVRDDGTIEGIDSGKLRVSSDVLQSLGIFNAYAALPVFDREAGEIRLNSPEGESSDIVKIREPQTVVAEKGSANNMIFLSENELQQLGLQPGETVNLQVGNVQRSLTVQAVGGSTTPAGKVWKLSENVVRDLGFPEGVNLRSSFNKRDKVLSLGPGIVVYNRVKVSEDGQREYSGLAFGPELNQRAQDYGVYVVFVDPNEQNREDINNGFVKGMMMVNGERREVRVPIPKVLYNKDAGLQLNGVAHELGAVIEYNVIPPTVSRAVSDKLWFDEIMRAKGLEEYRAESLSLNAQREEVEAFLETHSELMIKPQWGSQGQGIVRVSKVEGGYALQQNVSVETGKGEVIKTVSSLDELFQALNEIKYVQEYGRGVAGFFMQERIDLMKYSYRDPKTGETISGYPEPRVMVQRGVDGRVRIGGMVMRLQNDKSPVPHKKNVLEVLQGIFPNQPDKVEEMVKEIEAVSARVLQAVEQAVRKDAAESVPPYPLVGGDQMGELTVDFGITSDGKLKVIEANSKGSNFSIYSDERDDMSGMLHLDDAREQRTGGVVEYALQRTGMS